MAFGEKETGEVLFSYETRELPDEQPPLFPQVLILKAHISDSLPLSLSVLSRARVATRHWLISKQSPKDGTWQCLNWSRITLWRATMPIEDRCQVGSRDRSPGRSGNTH